MGVPLQLCRGGLRERLHYMSYADVHPRSEAVLLYQQTYPDTSSTRMMFPKLATEKILDTVGGLSLSTLPRDFYFQRNCGIVLTFSYLWEITLHYDIDTNSFR
jgi:hypothetical protein